MRVNIKRIVYQDRYFVALFIALFLPTFFMPMIQAPDTSGYLSYHPSRPLLLPLLLNLDYKLTGSHFIITRLTQVTLLLISLLTLSRWLKMQMKVSSLTYLIVMFFFLTPLIYYRSFFGRELLSEAISIPLFILFVVQLCQMFFFRTYQNILGFALCLMMLVLTRIQFIVFYVYIFLFIFWQMLNRDNLKIIGRSVLIFTCSLLLTQLVTFSYHSLLNHPCTGIICNQGHLFIQPTFFSTENDILSFEDIETKKIVSEIMSNLKEKDLLNSTPVKQRPDGSQYTSHITMYAKFETVYDDINNITSSTIGKYHLSRIKTTAFLKNMTYTFFKNHLGTNIKFWIWKFMYSFGGPLIAMQFLILFFLSFLHLMQKRQNHIAIMIFLLITTCLLNNLVITFSHYMLDRFLIYSCISMMILFLVMFSNSILDKNF